MRIPAPTDLSIPAGIFLAVLILVIFLLCRYTLPEGLISPLET
jgi:hypothetical protein